MAFSRLQLVSRLFALLVGVPTRSHALVQEVQVHALQLYLWVCGFSSGYDAGVHHCFQINLSRLIKWHAGRFRFTCTCWRASNGWRTALHVKPNVNTWNPIHSLLWQLTFAPAGLPVRRVFASAIRLWSSTRFKPPLVPAGGGAGMGTTFLAGGALDDLCLACDEDDEDDGGGGWRVDACGFSGAGFGAEVGLREPPGFWNFCNLAKISALFASMSAC